MKILHVITGLNDGGAEASLYRLCTSDTLNEHHVISLVGDGKYGDIIKKSGVDLTILNFKNFFNIPFSFFKLLKTIKEIKPDVIQTWMYHADFIGGIAGRLCGIRAISWGIHHSDVSRNGLSLPTAIVARVNAFLSRFIPAVIVSCSDRACSSHQEIGYQRRKFSVVPNGYDFNKFFMDDMKRKESRKSLGIDEECIAIGMVARYNPIKNHSCLLRSFKVVSDKNIDAILFLIGSGVDDKNRFLIRAINENGLEKSVKLLGVREDIPSVMRSLDIHVLSSKSEAFPNVLAEAMACGTPCVATDVGDSSLILSNYGWLVEAENSDALSLAILDAIEKKRSESSWKSLRISCANHIKSNFSVEKMVVGYNSVWKACLK